VLAPDLANVTAAKDAELATIRASGNASLPDLFCVPLLIKDNYDTVGIATANGAVALLDNFPSQEATIVSLSLS
jgi:amidase